MRAPRVTIAQLRALTAVRDGKVFHQIDATHNVYHCPSGVGGRSVRGLGKLGLIADSEKRLFKWKEVALTDAGSATLGANRR
jgi:hypothetical protein